MVVGPERRTLVELVIGRFPFPYMVSCIFVALLWTFVNSVAIGISKGIDILGSIVEWISLLGSPRYVVFLLLIFYVFYGPNYMRVKLLHAEKSISTLLPNGEEDFHSIFGRVSSLRPTLVVWVLLSVGIGLSVYLRPEPANPPPTQVLLTIDIGNYVIVALLALGMASLIWAYFSSLRGIRSMGKMRLTLQPYHKDRHLGLRPVGSLALSLVIVYLAFVGILVLGTSLGEPGPGAFVIPPVLLVLGLLLFFLPLMRLHTRMLEQKRLDMERLYEKSAPVFEAPLEKFSQDDLSRAFLLDMRRREISSVAGWPFDTSILAKFTVIILSVAAALIARYLAILLHI